MEIFEVLFRGKKAIAVKKNNGEIYVNLPVRRSKQGNEIRESISRDANGWKFSCFVVGNSDISFKVWIMDDGRIACYSSKEKKHVIAKEKFDPNTKKDGQVYNIAKELYKTIQQLEEYKKSDIPVSATYKLRREKLKTTLKLLGYDSIEQVNSELDDSRCYLSLSRIGEQLEHYINLGAYVHYEGNINDEDTIRVNIPEGMSREDFIGLVSPVTEEFFADKESIGQQEDKIRERQEIIPDYCTQISRKIPYAEWLLYKRIIQETAQLLLELNADLLSTNERNGLTDSSSLTGTELEDRISKLIDSRDFSKACNIESRFLVREATRLVKEAEAIISEVYEQTGNKSMTEDLVRIKDEEIEMIKQRKSQINEQGIGLDD